MRPDDAALVEFLKARIQEDAEVAQRAERGYETENTAHMTSVDHSAFAARFNPQWVAREIELKLTIVLAELNRAEEIRNVPVENMPAYVMPYVRLLASPYRNHRDFDERWLHPS